MGCNFILSLGSHCSLSFVFVAVGHSKLPLGSSMHLRPAAVICSCYLQSPATQLHGKDTKNECVGRKLEVKKYKNECSHSGPKEKPKQHLCSLRDATYYSVDKTTKISLNNMSHSCDCGYPVKIVFDSLAAQLTHHPLHYSCSCSAWCERSAKTVP